MRRCEGETTDCAPHLLGTFLEHRTAASAQNNEKLFSSVAANSIIRSDCIHKAFGDLLQHLVAHHMTVDVIDLFEMIDVAKKYLTRVSIASNRSSLKGLRRWSKAFASKARGALSSSPGFFRNAQLQFDMWIGIGISEDDRGADSRRSFCNIGH